VTRRLVPFLSLTAAVAIAALTTLATTQGADPETPRVKTVREKVLTAKLKLDIDKKMLRPIIESDLPDAIKEATKIDVKILPAPGQGVTLTSSFELKGEMTVTEALDKICSDKSWGWYVNVAKPGDQKDGAIFLTTNSKEHGYKEGTGPGAKETAKKDDAKDKAKGKGKETATKEEPKTGGDEREAAELLTRAKFQINTKQEDKAKDTLHQIIEKYPDTKQAADAKKLLEKLGK
jgi:hypothetical protein